jgi:hypothetical protein
MRAANETRDATAVLAGAGLHPQAVALLDESGKLIERAADSFFSRRSLTREAIRALGRARAELIAGPI